MGDQLPMVYVGPTSNKLGLTQYQMYTQLSPMVQAALQNSPSLSILLMPLDRFHDLRQDIFNKTSASVNHAITQLQKDEVL